MNTPIAPSDEEPIEATVRQQLWRLRARLVTPPDEERSVADLDRLLAAAREHAEVAPEKQPEPAEEEPPAGVVIRCLRFESVGRVAAAVVLVVAIGGGIAGVRDGSITIDALLGRSPAGSTMASPTAADDLEVPEAPAPAPESEAPSVPAEASGNQPARQPQVAPTTTEPDAEPAEPAERAESAESAEPAEPAEPAERVESDVLPSEPATDSSDAAPESTEPAPPEPETPRPPVPPKSTPAPAPSQEDIIAAPPAPSPTDGFGGKGDCPAAVEEDATPEHCTPLPDDPAVGDAVGEDEATDALEELARNRAGGVAEP